MGYEPPGLEHTPDDQSLAGFGSLMPKVDPKPGIVARVIKAPFRLFNLPFKAIKAVLGLPCRLLGGKRRKKKAERDNRAGK